MMRFLLTLPKRTTITRVNLLLGGLMKAETFQISIMRPILSRKNKRIWHQILQAKNSLITVADERSSNNK